MRTSSNYFIIFFSWNDLISLIWNLLPILFVYMIPYFSITKNLNMYLIKWVLQAKQHQILSTGRPVTTNRPVVTSPPFRSPPSSNPVRPAAVPLARPPVTPNLQAVPPVPPTLQAPLPAPLLMPTLGIQPPPGLHHNLVPIQNSIPAPPSHQPNSFSQLQVMCLFIF